MQQDDLDVQIADSLRSRGIDPTPERISSVRARLGGEAAPSPKPPRRQLQRAVQPQRMAPEVAPEAAPEPEPEQPDLIDRFQAGAAAEFAKGFQTLDVGSKNLSALFGGTTYDQVKPGVGGYGGMFADIQSYFEGVATNPENVPTLKPGEEESYVGQVAQGLGSMVPYALASLTGAGVAGPIGAVAAPAVYGAATQSTDAYFRILDETGDEDKAWTGALMNIPVGASEGLGALVPSVRGLAPILTRMNKATGGALTRSLLPSLPGVMLKSGLKEAGQEFVQGASSEAIDRYLEVYPEDRRTIMEVLGEVANTQAKPAFGVGLILGPLAFKAEQAEARARGEAERSRRVKRPELAERPTPEEPGGFFDRELKPMGARRIVETPEEFKPLEAQLKKRGLNLYSVETEEGSPIRGAERSGTGDLYININRPSEAIKATLDHEIDHKLETMDEAGYKAKSALIKKLEPELLREKIREVKQRYAESGEELNEADAEREGIAILMEEDVFPLTEAWRTNPKAAAEFLNDERSSFKKIVEATMDVMNELGARFDTRRARLGKLLADVNAVEGRIKPENAARIAKDFVRTVDMAGRRFEKRQEFAARRAQAEASRAAATQERQRVAAEVREAARAARPEGARFDEGLSMLERRYVQQELRRRMLAREVEKQSALRAESMSEQELADRETLSGFGDIEAQRKQLASMLSPRPRKIPAPTERNKKATRLETRDEVRARVEQARRLEPMFRENEAAASEQARASEAAVAERVRASEAAAALEQEARLATAEELGARMEAGMAEQEQTAAEREAALAEQTAEQRRGMESQAAAETRAREQAARELNRERKVTGRTQDSWRRYEDASNAYRTGGPVVEGVGSAGAVRSRRVHEIAALERQNLRGDRTVHPLSYATVPELRRMLAANLADENRAAQQAFGDERMAAAYNELQRKARDPNNPEASSARRQLERMWSNLSEDKKLTLTDAGSRRGVFRPFSTEEITDALNARELGQQGKLTDVGMGPRFSLGAKDQQQIGAINASQVRTQQQGDIEERAGAGEVGPTAEASRGNRPAEGGQGTAAQFSLGRVTPEQEGEQRIRDAAESGVRFSLDVPRRLGDFVDGVTGAIPAYDSIRTSFVDYLTGTRELASAAAGKASEKIKAVQATLLRKGIVADRLAKTFTPKMNALAKAIKERGVALEDINEFMRARVSPLANKRAAEVNRSEPGIEKMDGEEYYGGAYTDAEAAEVMRKLQSQPNYSDLVEIVKMVDAINELKIDINVRSGRISADLAAAMRQQYNLDANGIANPHGFVTGYGSLKSVPETSVVEDEFISGTGIGRGIGKLGKPFKARTGTRAGVKRELVNPVVQALVDLNAAVIREVKAEEQRAWRDFVQEVGNKEFAVLLPSLPTVRTLGSDGYVHIVPDPAWAEREGVLPYLEDGKWKAIEFKGNNRLIAEDLKGLTVAPPIKFIAKATQKMTSMMTRQNPVFFLTNVPRDFGWAFMTGASRYGEGFTKQYVRSYMPSFRELFANQFLGREPSKDLADYIASGAPISTMGVADYNKTLGDLEKAVQSRNGNLLFDAWEKYVGGVNDVFENASRFAAFRVAREQGKSVGEAALVAKEGIALNFEQTGRRGRQMNSLYGFFSAGINGTDAAIRLLTDKDPTVRRRAGALVAMTVGLGVAQEVINRSISGEDEDGKLFYDGVSNFEKNRNAVFMTSSDSYTKIPLPFGFNALYATGRNIGAYLMGAVSAEEAATDAVSFLMESASPFGAGPLAQVVSPTLLDPVIQMTMNQSFTGAKIAPDLETFGRELKAPHDLYWKNTPELPKWLAAEMAKATERGKTGRGYIDVRPDMLEHVFSAYTGGVGSFGINVIDNIGSVTKGEVPEARQIVGVRQLFGNASPYAIDKRYSDAREAIEQARNRFDELRKSGDLKMAAEWRKENAPLFRAYNALKNTERVLDRIDNTVENEDKRRTIKARFNKIYLSLSDKANA